MQAVLVDLERQGWDSLCRGDGASFYGRLMTPDAVMVLADGSVLDRDAVVASLGDAPPWRTYEIHGARVVRTSSDSAALVYVGTGFREQDEPALVAVMASVYRRLDGDWRLALYQQTPVPRPD